MRARAKLEIYKDAKGQLRWTLVAPNGYVIAASCQGHNRKREVLSICKYFAAGAVTIDTSALT